MGKLQKLLVRGLAMFGCSLEKTQDILMLVWEDEQTAEMLQYMLDHQDADPRMLYEAAVEISRRIPAQDA